MVDDSDDDANANTTLTMMIMRITIKMLKDYYTKARIIIGFSA